MEALLYGGKVSVYKQSKFAMCAGLRMNNEEHNIVDLQHAIYNSKNPTRKWLHNLRRTKIENAISDLNLASESRVLEIGPGSGVYLPFLCDRFASVEALDIEQAHLENISHLKDKYPNLGLIQADLFTFREDCEGYDLILCSEVIEHVENPKAFLKAICDCLTPGGALVLSTPQPLSFIEVASKIALSPLVIWLPRLIYKEPILPTGHISLTSRARIIRYCADNALSLQHMECFGLYLPVIAEAFGQFGLRLEKTLERRLKMIGVVWPLWTQLHILRK